jgi:hypothetical protein
MNLGDTKFAFLTSIRFWKLVLIGLIQALVAVQVISSGDAEAVAKIVQLILGGDVTIATIDRFAERSGDKNTEN